MSEWGCSTANSVFFLTQSPAAPGQPERVVRHLHPAIRQFVFQTMKRQMWGLVDPLHDEGAMRLKHALAMPAHLAGRHRAGGAMALRPLHHRRNRNADPRRNQPAAIAGQNRRYNTLT